MACFICTVTTPRTAGSTKRPLCNGVIFHSRPWRPDIFKFTYNFRSLGAENINCILIGKIVASLDGIENVHFNAVILCLVGKCGICSALSRRGMRTVRIDFGQNSDIQGWIGFHCLHCGIQTGTPASDNNNIKWFHTLKSLYEAVKNASLIKQKGSAAAEPRSLKLSLWYY